MIKFFTHNEQLFLGYSPETVDEEWVTRAIEADNHIQLKKRIFTFNPDDLIEFDAEQMISVEDYNFLFGKDAGEYFLIDQDILGLKHDLRLSKEMKIDIKTFVAYRDISIFRKIDALVDEEIVIGGSAENAIPLGEFKKLLKTFPGTTELNHYASARIARILKEYLGTATDAQKKLDNYLNQNEGISREKDTTARLKRYEVEKYTFIRDSLIQMLNEHESYSEDHWQKKIIEMILFIMPKYITCLSEVRIKDFYSPRHPKKSYIERRCDLMLVCATGHVDIIEVKKPFSNSGEIPKVEEHALSSRTK